MKIYFLIFLILFSGLFFGCSKDDEGLPPQPTNSKYQGSWNFSFLYNGNTITTSCVISSNGSFSSFFITFPVTPPVTQTISGFVDEYGRIFSGIFKENNVQVGTLSGGFLYNTASGTYETTIRGASVTGSWNAVKQ